MDKEREVDPALLSVLYGAISARRTARDSLMWQVPALSLTGQAFLFTIALSGDTTLTSRRLAAGLALVVALMSIQVFDRHQHLIKIDSELLKGKLEARMGLETYGLPYFHLKTKDLEGEAGVVAKLWWNWRSPPLWRIALFAFALAAAFTLVVTFVQPTWLTDNRNAARAGKKDDAASQRLSTPARGDLDIGVDGIRWWADGGLSRKDTGFG
jgi:hypothetical protein